VRRCSKTRKVTLGFLVVLAGSAVTAEVDSSANERTAEERLSFQTGGAWSPRVNLDADVAMVYGIGPELPATIKTWRDHGYTIHVMTGVAWGQYQDYLNGVFDGVRHWDEAQMDSKGELILHGGSKTIPYISPGLNYGRYLTLGVKRALDAGAQAIHLEEPEFWAAAGWEENFKREWKAYYGEQWSAPDSSVDAQYRASKLKYLLYRRALAQIFGFVQDYGKQNGRVIRCYVPTHSLISYANWRIVSPESSLIQVGADGYIAQVWTGTARTPNLYEGRRRERTFETAFLEYGAMQNLVRASGRRVWYLNDPIEDDPNHSWDDYRSNWESTLTASLFQPEVWRYEIMPWPQRVFTGKYPVKDVVVERPVSEAEQAPTGTGLGGILRPKSDVERVGIPKSYETELQAVIHALGEMKQPAVRWEHSGTRGIGVLVSDTMMFQRAAPHPSDPNLGSFYGLALPLLKHGLPVEAVQIENATTAGSLNAYRLLLLTYEGQKPSAPEFHNALAQWVHDGGALVVIDDDSDAYCAVREWWNAAPLVYKTPRQHLFEKLGITRNTVGLRRVGRGVVVRESVSPAALSYRTDGGEVVRHAAQKAAAAVGLEWRETNALVLRRGPYVIAAGLDESVPGTKPLLLRGRFVDLFDANLPVVNEVPVAAGKRFLLFDLDAGADSKPRVVAAACRVRNEHISGRSLLFQAEGISETEAVVRCEMRSAPEKVLLDGKPAGQTEYDAASQTLLLRFPNAISSVLVEVKF
jgi:hypothetical protein